MLVVCGCRGRAEEKPRPFREDETPAMLLRERDLPDTMCPAIVYQGGLAGTDSSIISLKSTCSPVPPVSCMRNHLIAAGVLR